MGEMNTSCPRPLFGPGDNWQFNACIGTNGNSWAVYTDGYDRAVTVMYEYAHEHRSDLDVLVYPLIYMARHSFELRLKHIHRDCCRMLGEEYRLPDNHNMLGIWKLIKPLLEKAFTIEDLRTNSCDDIEHFVNEFSKVDGRATAFRYPVDKSGGQSLSEEVTHINVRSFYDQFQKAAGGLDGLHIAAQLVLED